MGSTAIVGNIEKLIFTYLSKDLAQITQFIAGILYPRLNSKRNCCSQSCVKPKVTRQHTINRIGVLPTLQPMSGIHWWVSRFDSYVTVSTSSASVLMYFLPMVVQVYSYVFG